MMTRNSIQGSLQTGLRNLVYRIKSRTGQEWEPKDYGKIRMVCAIGERLGFRSICLNQRDMKVTGKILRKNVG